MDAAHILLSLAATAGTVAAVLFGLWFFRAALAWVGVVFGGLWGWTLGGMALGTATGALLGAVIGAALLGAMASTAERAMAALVGAFGFWVLALGAGSAAGLGGHPLAFVGLAGGLVGAGLVVWLHDFVVAVAVAVWGTGFLRLSELVQGGIATALPRDAWLNAPEMVVAGQFGQVLGDGPLRGGVLAGFVGLAYALQRLDALEARGESGKLGPSRLRRVGLLCASLSLLPLFAPVLVQVGGARFATWLHVPWHSLGIGVATWPAAALLCWLMAGWSRRSRLPARAAAALICGAGMLLFGVLVQHVADGVPLEPLLKDLMNPSGPLDPDVVGAGVFAALILAWPLSSRRKRASGAT